MKVMTVYAHPADTITNCGGTLALHADAGDEVVALVLTHGGRIHPNKYAEEWRKEHPDEDIVNSNLADIIENKKDELRRAAEIIGIHKLITLDLDDRLAAVDEDIVDLVAQHLAEEMPDVIICSYPLNAVASDSSHTVTTMITLAALDRAAMYLKNLDGRAEFHIKQVFFGGAPTTAATALHANGLRNDCFIDITPVLDRKIRAMDCFASQGYAGLFTRKLLESHNGEYGRIAGVAFAEPYCRYRNETHSILPLTAAAKHEDVLVRHVDYSRVSIREQFPIA